MGWLKKGKRKKARPTKQPRNLRRLDNALRASGINPDLAICDICGDEYNVKNQAAVDLHAH